MKKKYNRKLVYSRKRNLKYISSFEVFIKVTYIFKKMEMVMLQLYQFKYEMIASITEENCISDQQEKDASKVFQKCDRDAKSERFFKEIILH